MDKEFNLLINSVKDGESKEISGKRIYVGRHHGHEIIVAKCGIGKVNAALETYRLIEEYHPDMVINSGVAGGVDARMHIGDVLVADGVAYHDVWCGPGTEYGAADGYQQVMLPDSASIEKMRKIAATKKDIYFGLLASGDKFISKPEEVAEIKSHFAEALGCDMESGAIAQTCIRCGVPFMIIRVLSDMPGGGENISEYQNFWSEAPERTFDAVFSLLDKID